MKPDNVNPFLVIAPFLVIILVLCIWANRVQGG